MRLFKSEWMSEPTAATGALDLRRSRPGPQYGSARTAAVRVVCPPLPALTDLPEPADLMERLTVEHERAVLRALARVDRAA
jgi:hypothetical protein